MCVVKIPGELYWKAEYPLTWMEGSRDSAAPAKKKKIEKNKPRNRNTKQICQNLYKKQESLKTVGREGDFHRFVSHLIPDETQFLDFKFSFDNPI